MGEGPCDGQLHEVPAVIFCPGFEDGDDLPCAVRASVSEYEVVASFVVFGKLVAGFIPNGLSAWWPMHVPGDAVYGGNVLNSDYGCLDFSGNGHDIATINATPTWENDHPGLHWPSRPMVVPFVAASPPSTRRVSLGATYIDSSRVVLAG